VTKLSRRNLNQNVKSIMRKPRLRKVERNYNECEYDGHNSNNNSEEE